MGLSGSYSLYPVSSFGLYVEWSANQSSVGNYSDVTQNVYISYYTLDVGTRSDSNSSINGTSVTFTSPEIHDYSSGWKKKLIYTHTVRVGHNDDGSIGTIPLSASWRFDGTYSGLYIGTIIASTNINLDWLDRTPPYVSLDLSNATTTSVVATSTTLVPVDLWQYTINNGETWVTISNSVGTVLTHTITGLSPNTEYNVYMRARKQSNGVYGLSTASYVRTYGNSLLNSVNTLAVDVTSPVLTMNWSVYDNYIHTLVIKDGSTTVLTIPNLTCSIGTNNKTITLTAEQRTTILKYMTDKPSFTATFELSTFKDGTKIGSTVSKTATIQTTSGTSAPTFTDFTHKDSDKNGTFAITGDNQLYIKGYSSLQIEIGEKFANNESTIDFYRVTVGSDSKDFETTTIDYGAIGVSGDNVALKVEVIDSRGYATAITKNIKVVDYADVSITDYSIRRKNEVEPTVQLSFSGDISPITIGDEAQNGVVSAKFRYAPNGGDWSGWNNLTVTETTRNFEFVTLALSNSSGVLEFDPNSQYTIEVKITDRLSTDIMAIVLNKGTPLVSFRSRKVGINEANPTAALHIRGEGELLKLNDEPLEQYIWNVINGGVAGQTEDGDIFERIYPVGSVYVSVNPTSPNTLFGGEWEQIMDRFLLASGEKYQAGSVGGEAEHTLTYSEMPEHTHGLSQAYAYAAGATSATNGYIDGVASYNTAKAGGNQPHNNMPPYIVVYMWKRIK